MPRPLLTRARSAVLAALLAVPAALGLVSATARATSASEAHTPTEHGAGSEHAHADMDPDNDGVVAPPAPLEDCERQLTEAGISFRPATLPLQRERVGERGAVIACGAEQVVRYVRGPGKIRYNSAPVLTCRMALALGGFELLAQAEAQRHFGERVTRITQLGSYSCRKMVRFDFVSEHSYANALDIRELRLASGRRVSVREHFGALGSAPRTREARFLRTLAERAYDERLFSVVLTPYWDRLHADHFHFDQARYRVDGARPAR